MQNVSSSYLLEIKKPSRTFECKVTIGDNIYTNADIINITIEDVQPSDGFSIGAAVSKSLELTLSTNNTIYSNSIVKVEIGLNVGSKIEYVLMGYFNIDDIEKTDYSIKLTCYDNMMKFEKTYFSNLGKTSSLKNIVNELSQITGVEFTGSLPSYNLNKLEGFTCREILGFVASLCAGNAYITRDGKFTINTPKTIDYSITDENYIDLKTEESIYKVGAVTCKVNEKELTKGTLSNSSMEVAFENPWVNNSILTDIYNKLKGFEYIGYSMKWQGDLSLDVGDIISLTNHKGVKRNIPILSQKFNYNGGLTSEIGAKGESKNKNEFNSTGNLSNKVNRVVTDLLLVNEALINKADIEDLKVVNATIENLIAENVTITGKLTAIEGEFGTLKANVGVIDKLTVTHTAQINSLEANKASITQLNAVSANIGSLEVEVGKIQTLVNGNLSSENIQAGGITSDKLTIANGFITNAMISNLDVSKINAGDISTNKFRIVSDSGKMLISDNTIQISDNNRVRVQIGKDASNDYNMYVWDSNGKLMFDATGLKADGIKNKIIRDDMISDNANIDGGKINISSLITEINKDTNTSVIKSSKVQLDTVGQTLEVAFNSLKSNVDNIEIGGKNLLISSKLTTYAPYNSLEKTTTGTDKIVSKWNPTYTGNTFTLRNNDSKPISGVHTFSGYIKVNGEIPTKPYFQTISTYYGYMIENYYDSTTGYFRIVQKQGGTSTWIIHASTSRTSGSADIVEITKAKLEKGNKATDWTQAPEDAQGQIDTVKEITESHSTTIGVMQGQITTAINNTQIVKDGQTILLKDDYNRTVQTVNSMNSTIGSHTTKINEHTGKITGVETKTNELERTLNSVSSRLSSTETTVSNHTASINAVDGKINTAKNQAIVDSRKLIDTRNTNENPGWYLTNYPRQTIVEFKTFKVLGISSSIAYGTLTTNVPWADSSGGYPVQTFRSNSGGTYERKGVSTTEWGTWKQVEDTSGSQNKATQALNDAKGYTNGEITKVNITITTTNNKVSAIEQSMESITQRVSSTETKVITVTNTANSAKTQADKAIADATSAQSTANSANSKIDGLQIGGENLVPNSDFYITSGSKTGLDMSIYKELFEKNRGKQITCSLDVKLVNAIGTGNSSQRVGMEFSIKYKDGTMLYIGAWQYLSTTPITMNTRISRTTTILDKEIEAVYSMGVYIQGLGGGSVQVGRPQVELGSKASSWKKSTRDMETEISSTKSKVSTIETNLNGITQRVSTVEQNQTSVNGKVTSLESWKKSAESKLTKEGLTTIISNHYTTSNDVNGIVTSKGYQTHSQVQQTVDKLQAKFISSGGYNKLYNSAFLTGDLKRWRDQGTCTRSVVDSTSSGFAKVLKLTTTGINQGVYQTVTGLKIGKKYTLSGMVNPHADGGKCALMISNNGKWLGVYTKANAGWENLVLTFTAESTSVAVYLSTAGGGTAGTHYYTGIMLTDGELELPWSPHPSEVYDGITTIDKDGITVTSSNVKSKTTISANGFKIIKTDTNEEVFKVNSSGRLELYGIFRTRNGDRKSGYFGENQVTFYNWWSDSNEAIAYFYGGKTSDNKRSADVVGKDMVSLGVGEPNSGTKVLEGSSSALKIYKNTDFNGYKITNLNAINEDSVSKDLWINKIYLRSNQINSAMDSGNLNINYWRGGTATSSAVKVCDGTNSGAQGKLQCGDFKAYGTKNACVQTDIGYVDINAYETADYYFGDIGETILDNDGYSYVYIDSLFAQTVNTTRKYQVFLSVYGEGYANVIERTPNYFVIKGTPGIEIGYEIKAKRKGYEDYRLERDVNSFIKGKEHGLDLDYKIEKSKFEDDLTKSIQENFNLENKELILVIDKNLERAVRNKELINIVEEGVIYEDIN